MRLLRLIFTMLAVIVTLTVVAPASSHREAPAIAQDQFADNTDTYVFISPNDPDKMVIVANSVPLLKPDSGPNFYQFSDAVAYEICLDHNGDAFRDICYRWNFNTTVGNGDTFLYNTGPITSLDDPDLNVRQTYNLFRIDYFAGLQTTVSVVATDVPVAPWNVGDRSFPASGGYEAVAREAIRTEGETSMFAGPRDEPFFVDLHVFDLLGVGGAPTTDGLNVMSLVLEVPIDEVAFGGQRPAEGDMGPTSILGVYARNLRRVVEVRGRFGPPRSFGRNVQVSRLAFPLINEAVIPLQDKDNYNRTDPHNDVTNFGSYILFPELTGLLQGVLGLTCPDTPPEGRTDIVDLLSPNGTTAADLLRINITQGQTFSDTAFPNGRKLEDDVLDTILTLICSSDFSIPVSDLVDGNDLAFFDELPYLASPHSGNPLN